MEKLRAEIASTFSGRAEINKSELRRMNYLQNVLKESKINSDQPTIFV
jgi:hypothetical protein